MRRTFISSFLALAAVAILWSCSKKASSPPTAPGPVCGLSTTTLSFGSVTVGASADRSFTLTNTGGGTLSGTLTESCAEFALVGTTSYSLGASESTTFTLRFSPGSIGAKNCSVNTGSSGCSVVSCTGIGQSVPGPDCAVSPTSLDFGSVTVGEYSTRIFTITNAGTDTLRGSVGESCPDVRIRGAAAYAIPPGQGVTITVDFYPSSAGPLNCSISPGTGCASVSCSGTGTGGLSVACETNPTSLDFGPVPVGAGVTCKTFTVTNVSTSSIISGQPFFRCPCVDWEWGAGSGGSYYLNPGQSKTYTVCFNPTSTGAKEVTIIIPERGEFCSSVSCAGLGVEPPPVCAIGVAGGVPGTSIDLGTLAVGQAYGGSGVNFQIRNAGGGLLSGTVGEPCPSIEVTRPTGGGLGYSLTGNETAYFGIRFAPTAPGPQNCTIETGDGLCADVRVLANAITSSSPCFVETPVLDFGIVRPSLGKTVQRFLRITSVFSGGLSGEVYEPCPDFAFSGPSRTFALAAGHTEQWGVVFTPGGTDVGDRTCTLNLDRTGTSSCPIVQCTATVRSTPGTATPLTLAFPATRIGESRDLTFTINTTSPISGTVSVPCSEFSVVGLPTYNLASGGLATFTLRYTPTAVGLHQCTVSSGSDCESVWVYGSGYVP